MYTIEFQAKIIDGNIKIPEIYRKKVKSNAKVILLAEDMTDNTSNMIDELMASPLRLSDFKPLKRKDIYERV